MPPVPWKYVELFVTTDSGQILVIYPIAVQALNSQDVMKVGLLSCAIGGGTCAGLVLGGLFNVRIGYIKYQMMASALVMAVFIGSLAAIDKNTPGWVFSPCSPLYKHRAPNSLEQEVDPN